MVVIVLLGGAFIGVRYGQRLLQSSSNTTSQPQETILVDQSVDLTIQFLGGGYSWKLTLTQIQKLTVVVLSNDTVFVDLTEDRINSPLTNQCNRAPVYLLPQTLIHSTTGTTNGHWSITVPEECVFTLSVNPPMATYYTNGQIITAHVIVKAT